MHYHLLLFFFLGELGGLSKSSSVPDKPEEFGAIELVNLVHVNA